MALSENKKAPGWFSEATNTFRLHVVRQGFVFMGGAHTLVGVRTQTNPSLPHSFSSSLRNARTHAHTQLSQRTAVRQADRMTRINNKGSGTQTQTEN